MKRSQARPNRRNVLKAGAGSLLIPFTLSAQKAPAQGGRKPFDGVTLNVSTWSAAYPTILADYIHEFTDQTGIKVNYDTAGFPVYNQRADLELSTQGSALDVMNVTFIYTSRWIGAGWLTPLDPFIKDTAKTPANWNYSDFLSGTVKPMLDKKGAVYGIPWISDVLISGAARFDLLKAHGLGMPDTFDELDRAMQIVNKKDGVPGFIAERHYGWNFPSFLQSFGGNVFRDPPDDLMPTLDSPEAVEAAEYFAKLLTAYGPAAASSYTYEQVTESLRQGKINYSTHNHMFLALLGEPGSTVANTVNFSILPKGPKGRFPGVASHGWGIPVGAKNKDASWEFIKWSLSKELVQRMTQERGLSSVTRKSVVESDAFKKKMTINGVDTGKILLDTVALADQGHMKYRTVHVYPQVDVQINQAIERIVSGQMGAKESLKQAQANCITDLRRAGVKFS